MIIVEKHSLQNVHLKHHTTIKSHIVEKPYQGQTLKKVGICLRSNFFSHGQFYVACSHVQSSKDLKNWIPNAKDLAYTDNVVYPEKLEMN